MQIPQAYIKVKEIDTRLGKVILYSNPTRTLLYAEASGYIPSPVLSFINRTFGTLIPIDQMLKSEQELQTILNEYALLKD